jgi:hypothetical protein
MTLLTVRTRLPLLFSFRLVRALITTVAISICFLGILISGKLALSRVFIAYAMGVGNLAAADESIRLSPADAEAHFVRAEVLKTTGATTQAVTELERAVALRPRDYFLWLELGLTRDQTADTAGALLAFNEAVRLAPHYAQPLWQRGNLLLRSGRYDQAFDDLRRAAESNPDLLPNLIDLAWGFSKGDPKVTEQLAQIATGKMRIAFARFLAKHGKTRETLEQFRAAGSVPDPTRRELVQQLIALNAFAAAFELWKGGEGVGKDHQLSSVYDGGFEGPLSLEKVAFGWRIPRNLQGVNMSLDPTQPHSGSKSLRMDFAGDSNAESSLVSQLILVEPSSRYRISFAARTQDIVTGGMPLAIVNDAAGEQKRLGQSASLRQGSNDWQMFSFEFTAEPATKAVVLSLQRKNCTTSPCPIFGSVWLDSFSIERVK